MSIMTAEQWEQLRSRGYLSASCTEEECLLKQAFVFLKQQGHAVQLDITPAMRLYHYRTCHRCTEMNNANHP